MNYWEKIPIGIRLNIYKIYLNLHWSLTIDEKLHLNVSPRKLIIPFNTYINLKQSCLKKISARKCGQITLFPYRFGYWFNTHLSPQVFWTIGTCCKSWHVAHFDVGVKFYCDCICDAAYPPAIPGYCRGPLCDVGRNNLKTQYPGRDDRFLEPSFSIC